MFVISPEQKDHELCLPLQREEYEVLEVSPKVALNGL